MSPQKKASVKKPRKARRPAEKRAARATDAARPRPLGWCGARHRVEPTREPFPFGPRDEPVRVQPLTEPPVSAPYDYGFPVTRPDHPDIDEGGEGPAEA